MPPAEGSFHNEPSSHGGADLRGLVPFVQAPDGAQNRLRSLVESDSTVIEATQLQIVSKLGTGGFGHVYKCRYTPDASSSSRASEIVGTPSANGSYTVAVKVLKTSEELRADAEAAGNGNVAIDDLSEKVAKDYADALTEFAHEVLMLKELQHPNVIAYVGCSVFAASHPGGQNQMALVLENAEHGSLKDMIQGGGKGMTSAYTVDEGLQWCHDIAKGMHFLHHCTPPIMHRDLKPGNIMICGQSNRRTAKVGDFGLAALCLERRKEMARNATIALSHASEQTRTRVYKQFQTTGGVGSLRYMAPENYRGEPYGDHVDQYSFAMIMYEVLLREKAFSSQYLSETQIAEAAAGSKHLRPPVPKKWPPEVKELLDKCWHPDPAMRPSFKPIAHIIQSWLSPDNQGRILKGLSSAAKSGLLEKMGFGKPSHLPISSGMFGGSNTSRT
mmetsp:Transcript_6823/g.18438  ORF Transcript_6823/g.18438 Transcript_6823/m.18438 type:complete len:444 (-) Transcript_6823:494-1825(-)